jgi:hypothetical protein
MSWTRGVDIGAFLHEIGCCPGVIDHYGWNSTNPYSYEGIVVILTPLLEGDPWFPFGKVQMVANDRQGEWTWRKLLSLQQDSGIVDEDDEDGKTN